MAQIIRRQQSRPAQHRDVALTACEWPVELSIQPSAVVWWEHLIVLRCPRCDAEALMQDHVARAISVHGVIPEPPMTLRYERDEDGPWNNWGAW